MATPATETHSHQPSHRVPLESQAQKDEKLPLKQALLKEQRELGETRQKQVEMELLNELMTENHQLKAAVSNLSSENEQLKNMLESSERERVNTKSRSTGPVASKEKSPPPDPFIVMLGHYLQLAERKAAEKEGSKQLADAAAQTSPRSPSPAEVAQAQAQFAAEVTDMASLMLAVLFNDKQFRRFINLLQLVAAERHQQASASEPTTVFLFKESLHAYLRSDDFQSHPDRLVSVLQSIGCRFPTKLLLPPKSKVAKRKSWPPTAHLTEESEDQTKTFHTPSEPTSPY